MFTAVRFPSLFTMSNRTSSSYRGRMRNLAHDASIISLGTKPRSWPSWVRRKPKPCSVLYHLMCPKASGSGHSRRLMATFLRLLERVVLKTTLPHHSVPLGKKKFRTGGIGFETNQC
eukprot:EG_transcript_22640